MSKFENVHAIVFDMDGVLLDSETVCDRTWAMAFKELGLSVDNSILMDCIGCNKVDSARILREHLGQNFNSERFLERTSYFFHQIEGTEGVPLMPYVTEALEYLSKKYVLCVASSTREESVRRLLTKGGIINYFKTFTTGDMVTHSKPNPEIYLMACKSIGFEPSECVAIEDSYNGVRSAVAAGIRTIMIPDKLAPNDEMRKLATIICPSFKEVVDEL